MADKNTQTDSRRVNVRQQVCHTDISQVRHNDKWGTGLSYMVNTYRAQYNIDSLAVSLQSNAHGKCCVELVVACAANYQPLCMMECLGCEMEVVCGQEGPMTEPAIIHVATHTLFLGSNCTRNQERPGHRTSYMSILYLTYVELHVSIIPCRGLLSIHTYSKSAR